MAALSTKPIKATKATKAIEGTEELNGAEQIWVSALNEAGTRTMEGFVSSNINLPAP